MVKRQTLQRFLVEPDNMTVNIGESVILPCRVSNKAGALQCKLLIIIIIILLFLFSVTIKVLFDSDELNFCLSCDHS